MTCVDSADSHSILYQDWNAPANVSHSPVTQVGGHWLVSTRRLVRRVLADVETFAPDNALDAVTPMSTQALRILTQYDFRLPPTLANNGTRSHPGLRAIVAEYLQPARVLRERPFAAAFVRERVAGAAAALGRGEQVDLHATFAHALPLVVLARVIGLPDDDIDVVKRFSVAALELFWAPLNSARQEKLAEIVGAYHARLRHFARVGAGLAAALRTHAADSNLDEDDVVAVLFFLLVAGQETTSQFLTALLQRLLQTPAVVRGLVEGSISATDVVAEGLRMDTSVVSWRRVATRDAVLGGVAIPAGGSVLMRLAAAGRDPAIVARPRDFVPGQPGSRRHLAFGAGSHRCVGAYLATMEAEVVVEETAGLLQRCRLVRAPIHSDNLSFRIPDALLVADR